MFEIQASSIRIAISAGSEDVVFICRRPSGKEISKFLGKRFTTHRNKVQSRLYEARAEFVDSILLDVENVTFRTVEGETVPLNSKLQLTDADRAAWAVNLDVRAAEVDWKSLIPINWKSSVAMFFEDSGSDEESSGN